MKNRWLKIKQPIYLSLRARACQRLGSSVVEVLIALAIVAFGLLAFVSGLGPAIRGQNASAQQQLATKLSTQALEWLRSERDRVGWSEFQRLTPSATYCLYPDVTSSTIYNLAALSTNNCVTPMTQNPSFTRSVVIQNGLANANEIDIRVTTTWVGNSTAATPDTSLKSVQVLQLWKWY